jgi:hypothetical protein
VNDSLPRFKKVGAVRGQIAQGLDRSRGPENFQFIELFVAAKAKVDPQIFALVFAGFLRTGPVDSRMINSGATAIRGMFPVAVRAELLQKGPHCQSSHLVEGLTNGGQARNLEGCFLNIIEANY